MYDINAEKNKLVANVKLGVTEEEVLAAAKQNHLTPGVVKPD